MTSRRTLEYLTQEQIDQFHRDGYLIVPRFLSPGDTETLLKRSKQLLDEFNPEDHPLTKFTTGENDHIGDDYFLSSGDKIRYFLEVGAIDKQGNLTRDKCESVNKIGHALHELDPSFRRVTLENERLKQLVRDLRFHRDPVALQSMVIIKQPGIGGEVPEHNDSLKELFWEYTQPPTALGFWIALEQCTKSNGALYFLPGSHLTTPITKRFVRLSGGGTGFESLSPSNDVLQVRHTGEYVMVPCEPGDLVLIHGSVLHKSPRNLSAKTRFAYTFHMVDSVPYATYDEKNWLQPTPNLGFSRVFGSPIVDPI